MTPAVKICGVRTPEAAQVAAEAGADFIGLIFAPSKRQLTPEQAKAIVTALRATPAGRLVQAVGVFVNEQPETIAQIAAEVGLDWVQLSGHEPATITDGLSLPVFKAVRFDGHPSEAQWLTGDGCGTTPLVIDAHVAGVFGGAGVVADWRQAGELAAARQVLLAGGLTPDNVGAAIEVVRPWGVDVSSGVETDGRQDHAKIRAFVAAAKNHI